MEAPGKPRCNFIVMGLGCEQCEGRVAAVALPWSRLSLVQMEEEVKASGSVIFDSLIQSSSRSTQVGPDLRLSHSCSTYEPQSVFTVGPERLRCCVRVNSWQVRFP